MFLRLGDAKIEFYTLNLVLHANCAPLSVFAYMENNNEMLYQNAAMGEEERNAQC
jgi:hypothetical protein